MSKLRNAVQVSNAPDIFDSCRGVWVKNWSDSSSGKYIQYHTRAAVLWRKVVARCREGGAYQRRLPSYVGTINKFSGFQHFATWANLQPGYDCVDESGNRWHLDKDILADGETKVYSPDSCCFVPAAINTLFIARAADRGAWPIGVHVEARSGKFRAQCSFLGKETHLGMFTDPFLAHSAWQKAKAQYIREMVDWYSALPGATPKVCLALTRRAVQLEADLGAGNETTRL